MLLINISLHTNSKTNHMLRRSGNSLPVKNKVSNLDVASSQHTSPGCHHAFFGTPPLVREMLATRHSAATCATITLLPLYTRV